MLVSNALIGLREGLEAALVVVILVAFLVKSGRADAVRYVWAGVGAAVAGSALVGALLTFGSHAMSEEAAEAFTGVASLIAVVFVTGMVFWMRRAARSVAGELTGRLDSALAIGPYAVALVGFLGVGREGLEIALFAYASAQSAGDGSVQPVLGWALGLGAAIALGWLVYQGAVRIDLARFFRWTGVLLVFVAAGIVAYAVHELQEAGWLPGEDARLFDLRGSIDPASWYASVVRGMFNLRPAMSVLEVLAYLGYLLPVLWLFLRPARSERPALDDAAATSPSAATDGSPSA